VSLLPFAVEIGEPARPFASSSEDATSKAPVRVRGRYRRTGVAGLS